MKAILTDIQKDKPLYVISCRKMPLGNPSSKVPAAMNDEHQIEEVGAQPARHDAVDFGRQTGGSGKELIAGDGLKILRYIYMH